MCALCAVLGSGRYWTDAAGHPAFEADGHKVTNRAERTQRIRLMNAVLRPFALSLEDYGGSAYILSDRSGKSELVYHLNAIWAAAERLAGAQCDPLAPAYLEEMDTLLATGDAGRCVR